VDRYFTDLATAFVRGRLLQSDATLQDGIDAGLRLHNSRPIRNLLKRWANHHTTTLWKILGRRFIMYGEWLYAKHTIPYDDLPHYFLEFDIMDRESATFLTTDARSGPLAGGPVVSVPVLGRGLVRTLNEYLGRSRFSRPEDQSE